MNFNRSTVASTERYDASRSSSVHNAEYLAKASCKVSDSSLGDVAGLSLCNTSTSMLDHSFTNDAGNVRARELLEGL